MRKQAMLNGVVLGSVRWVVSDANLDTQVIRHPL
jgi:hypothetical protein